MPDWNQPWDQGDASGFDPGMLHPAVAQSLGLPPPDALVPLPPEPLPAPTPLPDATPPMPPVAPPPAVVAPTAPSIITPGADYHVPVTAFDHKPPAPPKPLTYEQGMAKAQQDLTEAQTQQQDAIDRTTQINTEKDAVDAASFKRYQDRQDENNAKAQANADQEKVAFAANSVEAAKAQKAVDDYKIDSHREWDKLGMGGHIGMYIAIALSGIGDAMQGKKGPNAVVEMMQQKIHDSIAQQVDQRNQLKEKVSSVHAARGDIEHDFSLRNTEILRQEAQYNQMLSNDFKAAALASADPMHQAEGLRQSAQLREQSAKQWMEWTKEKSAHDAQQAQLGIAQSHLNIAAKTYNAEYGNPDAIPGQGPQGLKWQDRDLKAAKIAEEAAAAQAKSDAKKAGKLDESEAKFAVSAAVRGSNGAVQVLRQKDGTPYLGNRNEKQTDETTGMLADVDEYHQLAAKMIQSIKDHGGESDFLKSDAWKTQQSRMAQISANLHDVYHIARFSEGTQEMFSKMATAGVDPTSFTRDATSVLKSSAEDLAAKVNTKLIHANYDGPPLEFPDVANGMPEHQATPIESATERLKSKPNASTEQRRQSAGREWLDNQPNLPRGPSGSIIYTPDVLRGYRKAMDDYDVGEKGKISPTQVADIKDLTNRAINGDESALAALDDVGRAPKSSPTSGVVAAEARDAAVRVRVALDAMKRPAEPPIAADGTRIPSFAPYASGPTIQKK